MHCFIEDDGGYLAWLAANPGGFVLNTTRNPSAGYLKLHHADCRTVTGVPARGRRWTLDYVKVCGTRAEIEAWCEREFAARPETTCDCQRPAR